VADSSRFAQDAEFAEFAEFAATRRAL